MLSVNKPIVSAMNKPKVIGVLKLNTHFPRLAGDIGNPDSFRYPVLYQTVTSAIPANITIAEALPPLLQKDFCDAATLLIDQNVSMITTSCGFLTTMQHQLSALSDTPVICSALCLLPLIAAVHGGPTHVGVLTFNRETLNEKHLGAESTVCVEGLLPQDSLRQVIIQDAADLNRATAQKEALAACDRLLTLQPQLRAIVLECTNLSPYKQAIKEHSGMAVYDIVDAVHWLVESQPSS